MSEKEQPLPKPPKTPFGKIRPEEEMEDHGPLMADKMAMAMAEGRLDEFMKQNLPDNEQARKLAMMMLGMTGVMPPTGFPSSGQENGPESASDTRPDKGKVSQQGSPVPEDVMKAVHSGDMYQLMELLRREHQKRTGSEIPLPPAQAQEPGFNTAPSNIEKEILDRLMEIASANSVTLDWLILRAMKVYIQEYGQTGKL